jgi:hypothetical protein
MSATQMRNTQRIASASHALDMSVIEFARASEVDQAAGP